MSDNTFSQQTIPADSVPERNILSIVLPTVLASVTLTWWAALTWVGGYVVGTW